jgi:hypothetical protein
VEYIDANQIEEVKEAILYLADVWDRTPGNSEDPEICHLQAEVLRDLLDILESLPPSNRRLPKTTVQALVQEARRAGFSGGGSDICNG